MFPYFPSHEDRLCATMKSFQVKLTGHLAWSAARLPGRGTLRDYLDAWDLCVDSHKSYESHKSHPSLAPTYPFCQSISLMSCRATPDQVCSVTGIFEHEHEHEHEHERRTPNAERRTPNAERQTPFACHPTRGLTCVRHEAPTRLSRRGKAG